MKEYACKEAIFHFNKKHLEDPTIPMWCLKFHGETFYIHHLTSNLPWTTKETPNNPSTKGSIKFKDCLIVIDDDNCATISKLTPEDKERLRKDKPDPTRVIFDDEEFEDILKSDEIEHSPLKIKRGNCETLFTVCDLLNKDQVLLLSLKYPRKFRILKPNEEYYKWYDEKEPVFENTRTGSLWEAIKDWLVYEAKECYNFILNKG